MFQLVGVGDIDVGKISNIEQQVRVVFFSFIVSTKLRCLLSVTKLVGLSVLSNSLAIVNHQPSENSVDSILLYGVSLACL